MSGAEEIPDCITPATPEEMFEALAQAWLDYFGTAPSKPAICLLIAQWALETGWGREMHCYNVGNIKAGENDGRCWTYFACGEELPGGTAHRLVAADPLRVKIKRRYLNKRGEEWASVKFSPKHPYCRFRAYASLKAGVEDYIIAVRFRFARAWPAVVVGNATMFAHLLKQSGYYTASEGQYAAGLTAIHAKLLKALEHQELPVLSAADEAEIKALTALSLDAIARDENKRK